MDSRPGYCSKYAPAPYPVSPLQGGDVKGFLRHQQLLDEAMHFYLNEFEVLIIDGQPQLSPQLDAWSAPYLARIVAAQVGLCFAS